MNFKYLYAPSSVALLFIFGLVYLYAFAHFLGIRLTGITAGFYLIMAVWTGALLWMFSDRLKPANWIDISFFLFFVWVLISLMVGGYFQQKAPYFLCLSLIPFICGRLFQGADYHVMVRLSVFIAGVCVLLALIDRMVFPLAILIARWPFFGVTHGSLLVGMIASIGLITSVSYFLDKRCKLFTRYSDVVFVILTVGFIVFMVWVMARGFLLASLVAGIMIIMLGGGCSKWRRFFLLCVILAATGVSMSTLQTDGFFAQLLTSPAVNNPWGKRYFLFLPPSMATPPPVNNAIPPPVNNAIPILGEESCRPIEENINSIAIRWVLYHEAIAITEKHPWWGGGAASFGKYSCAGEGAFPHSTILQVFSELGVAAGLLYLSIFGMVMYIFLLHAIRRKTASSLWLLGVYISVVLTDQIYGNYFMDVNGSLMLGLGVNLLAANRQNSDV